MHRNYIKKKVVINKLMQYDRKKNERTMLLVQQQV